MAAALVVAALLPDTAILTLTNIPVEPIALIVALPLGYLALQVIASRDARRFVVGFGVAVVAWFAILYPNISALPLPSAVVAAYQGILPTYLYAFQFPVSTVDPERGYAALHADAGGPAARPDRDLPGGRLLGVGLEARAGRTEAARAERRRRDDAEGLARTRRRLRHRRPEVRRELSRSRRAGGSRSRSSPRPWPSPAAS